MCLHPCCPRLRCGLCEYRASLREVLTTAAAQERDFDDALRLFDQLSKTQGLRSAHRTLSILADRNIIYARRPDRNDRRRRGG